MKFPLLIEGEPGVGKSQFAKAVHLWGYCAEGPFLRLDGATISDGLAHGDLFGHVKGSYTGSIGNRQGAVRRAQGGTLFLDEVHMMPTPIQGLLLTLAEEGTIRPFGSDQEIAADVRLMFGTNRDLKDLVQRGTFLPDLYARIEAARLRVPPLRERVAEMKSIVSALLPMIAAKEFLAELPGPIEISDEAIEALKRHPWEANVRGLRNALVHAIVEAEGGVVRSEHVERYFEQERRGDRRAVAPAQETSEAGKVRSAFVCAMYRSGGEKASAARLLGLNRSTLYRRLDAHGIDDAEWMSHDIAECGCRICMPP